MAIEMTDVNKIVQATLVSSDLEYTIDNRVECLAAYAHGIAKNESIEIEERVRISLEISVEILRLRMEKQMFEQ